MSSMGRVLAAAAPAGPRGASLRPNAASSGVGVVLRLAARLTLLEGLEYPVGRSSLLGGLEGRMGRAVPRGGPVAPRPDGDASTTTTRTPDALARCRNSTQHLKRTSFVVA